MHLCQLENEEDIIQEEDIIHVLEKGAPASETVPYQILNALK